MSGEGKRTIKLFCPSLSKSVPFVAWDEQRLDLGSIARMFGLEPSTLRLNGHFISRGVDLMASSVTWKSLLSFFSSRGLRTGTTDADALIVDGKLSKLGTKRAHVPGDVEKHQNCSVNMMPQLEDSKLHQKKKLKESSWGFVNGHNKFAAFDGFGLKRKQCLEDISPLKKMRTIGPQSGSSQAEENDSQGTIPNTQYRCSFIGDTMKRMRENEIFVTAPSKRTR